MHTFVILKGEVFVAVSRRDVLWQEAAQSAATLNRIAEDDSKLDINKVEAAKDIYQELRLQLRELGIW